MFLLLVLAAALPGIEVRAIPADTHCPPRADVEAALAERLPAATPGDSKLELVYRVERRAEAFIIDIEIIDPIGAQRLSRQFVVRPESCRASALPVAQMVVRAVEQLRWAEGETAATPAAIAPPPAAEVQAGPAAERPPPVQVRLGAGAWLVPRAGDPARGSSLALAALGVTVSLPRTGGRMTPVLGAGVLLPPGERTAGIDPATELHGWPLSLRLAAGALTKRGLLQAEAGVDAVTTLQRVSARGVTDARAAQRLVTSLGAHVTAGTDLTRALSLHATLAVLGVLPSARLLLAAPGGTPFEVWAPPAWQFLAGIELRHRL